MKPSFAVVGCGRVGTAFSRYLAGAGYRPAGFSSRRPESARDAATLAGAPDKWFAEAWDAARTADILLITTPDGVIAETCREIAKNGGIRKDSVVLHCSGMLPSTILAAVADGGAKIGSMHPLQSFAARQYTDNPFAGIMMAIEGDAAAIEAARMMAEDLGATPFVIHTDGKTLYHASAVLASNYLATLMAVAVKLMAASGAPEEDAFQILKPLVMGTLGNIETLGAADALTGPIARGDVDTVAAHLTAIGNLSADMLKFYKQLGRATVPLARSKGTLSEEAARRLLEMLA
jgi:predicted short-subunit dehydrogenase-like oxidoreductase (DUF2520 family)